MAALTAATGQTAAAVKAVVADWLTLARGVASPPVASSPDAEAAAGQTTKLPKAVQTQAAPPPPQEKPKNHLMKMQEPVVLVWHRT